MRRLACLALAAATVLVTAGDHGARESGLTTTSIVAPESPPGLSGMVVEIDKVTGLPVTPTPETIRDLLEQQDRNRLSRSSEGLVEVPSAVAGGGYMVDLQGRFQHSMTVTIDASGSMHSTCATAVAGEEVTETCVDH